MVIEELTEWECRAILGRARLARLACALDNQPYIVPLHVDFHDRYLYGFSTLGQKIEWMRQNPLVCIEVEELATDYRWATVVIFGQYEELPDSSEYEYDRHVAQHLFQRHPLWWEPASVPIAGHQPRPLIVFRIVIGRTTGRRAGPETEEPALLGDSPDKERPRGLAQTLRRVLRRR